MSDEGGDDIDGSVKGGLGMDTLAANASSDGANFSSDEDNNFFNVKEDEVGLAALEIGDDNRTMGTKNTAALIRAERNKAFYDALDQRMDLLVTDIV